MARFRSYSNEILNFRTIDDGLVEDWRQGTEEDSLQPDLDKEFLNHFTKSSKLTTSQVDHVILTTDKQNCVTKGFNTVLGTDDSSSFLKSRSFYKSDFAPHVRLRVRESFYFW